MKAEDINSFDVRPLPDPCGVCGHPPHEGRMCGNALTNYYGDIEIDVLVGVCRCGGLQKCPKCSHYHVREDGWYVKCEQCPECFITVPDA